MDRMKQIFNIPALLVNALLIVALLAIMGVHDQWDSKGMWCAVGMVAVAAVAFGMRWK